MQKINKKTIFIDLDGTILDVSERVYQVYKEILQKHGKKFLNKGEYLKLKRKKNSNIKILKETKAEDIFLKFKKEWEKKIEDSYFLNLDKVPLSVRKTLVFLRNENKLILVTLRNRPKRLTIQLRNKKLDKFFHKILNQPPKDHELSWKTKYNLIRKYKYFTKKDSAIIGDTETDILVGKNLRIRTIAVFGGMRDREFLKKYKPDNLIKNITKFNQWNF